VLVLAEIGVLVRPASAILRWVFLLEEEGWVGATGTGMCLVLAPGAGPAGMLLL
jgi:hypothetical protein